MLAATKEASAFYTHHSCASVRRYLPAKEVGSCVEIGSYLPTGNARGKACEDPIFGEVRSYAGIGTKRIRRQVSTSSAPVYRAALLIINSAPLGPHSRPMHRALLGEGGSYERGTPVFGLTCLLRPRAFRSDLNGVLPC